MSKWNRIRDRILSGSDHLDKQIYNKKIFIEQKASEIYAKIEDEKSEIKILTKAEILSLWSDHVKKNSLGFTLEEEGKFDKYILNKKSFLKKDDGVNNYKISEYESFIQTQEESSNNILTVKQKIKIFEDYLIQEGFEKIDGDFLLYRFLLKENFTRIQYNKLKNLSKESLSFILKHDHIQQELLQIFEEIFESAFINGKKIDEEDIDLLEITEVIEISRVFIGIFDLRFAELKKK